MNKRQTFFPMAEDKLVESCLTYLSFTPIRQIKASSPHSLSEKIQAATRIHPFLNYAAKLWGFHAQTNLTPVIEELVLSFLTSTEKIAISSHICLFGPSSATHLAAYFGLHQILPKWQAVGVEPDSTDFWGRTPLIIAAIKGSGNVARDSISRDDVDPMQRDGQSDTVMHYAVTFESPEIAKVLVEHSPVILNARGRWRRTPLSLAVFTGTAAMTRFLIDEGVPINHEDSFRETPLFTAASSGQVETTKLLIDSGAVVDHEEEWGRTPLFAAVLKNRIKTAGLLINSGADIEHKNKGGQTPSFEAVTDNHKDVARLLIDSGASVNVQDVNGRTALLLAIEKNNLLIVRMLLDADANINAQDYRGFRPISYAARSGRIRRVETLIEAKVDFSLPDKWGLAPRERAFDLGMKEVVAFLDSLSTKDLSKAKSVADDRNIS